MYAVPMCCSPIGVRCADILVTCGSPLCRDIGHLWESVVPRYWSPMGVYCARETSFVYAVPMCCSPIGVRCAEEV